MIQGVIHTIEIDTNALRGDKVTTYLLEPEWALAVELTGGALVRAVSEEGHAYLAQVDDVKGSRLFLTLLGPWLAASRGDGSLKIQGDLRFQVA